MTTVVLHSATTHDVYVWGGGTTSLADSENGTNGSFTREEGTSDLAFGQQRPGTPPTAQYYAMQAYVAWDLSAITGPVSSASLRLKIGNDRADDGDMLTNNDLRVYEDVAQYDVAAVLGTWRNPAWFAARSPLATLPLSTAGGTIWTVDVTSRIAARPGNSWACVLTTRGFVEHMAAQGNAHSSIAAAERTGTTDDPRLTISYQGLQMQSKASGVWAPHAVKAKETGVWKPVRRKMMVGGVWR